MQDSDELYLLSGAGANVKVRDALMDIKVLREVNADGLEQWTPVLKAGFPLPADEVAQVLEALGLPLPDRRCPRATRRTTSWPASPRRAGRARRAGAQAARALHHRRLHGRAVRGDGRRQPTRTMAVESEDAAAVIRRGPRLGLGA